ncbi:LIP-domain-containing protein [Aspergillus heteromorphus CBS 117.55]|uniref:LIP-domain-containing protein n=1 Tax=Aspergillus heteromorphus CBS 117.55 TaxID=1448321 RepID=A0A317UZN4_9EURO|nr:LIP-domain-containing protein [Aspergillus heteromorphus CBS 117.55]PWY66017.1 LIP-domain-containing protein [Aspergillus heteromorphus CBS 117.55]
MDGSFVLSAPPPLPLSPLPSSSRHVRPLGAPPGREPPAGRLCAAPHPGLDPDPPSEDPWYSAPRGFESAAPGEILRIRAAPGNLTTVVGNASAAYNILYRTTNSLYKPSAAAAAANGSSLLSYQIAYDSFDVNASPSYAMYTDPSTDIATALKLGWFVNVPDFEGPLASFTAGVASGHATLDSVRAVLSSGFGLDEHARYALWGYSGGALASEWAAELQGQYAPELTFSGAAVGGLTPNITNVMDSVSGTLSAGLVPAAILGISSQHPDTYAYIVSQLKPNGTYNRARFLATKDLDLDEAELYYLEQDIFDYFVDGYETFYNPVVQKALNQDGYMGYHGVPQMPVFAYKAINDEVSPIADSDQLIARYCGVGVNILYERNTVGGHSAEEVNSDARAWAWLTSIFDGTYASKYATSGCTIRNVTLNITSSPL